jgi:hypothetical protein
MDDERIDKWRKDIDQLAECLPEKHINLFYRTRSIAFHNKIERLQKNLHMFDDIEILVNITKIVASARDAHTSVIFPARSFLPFKFYWFEEGIFVVASTPGYGDLVNCRLERVNGMPVDEAVNRLRKVVSYENESFLKSQLPNYLSVAEVLYGLEIIDETSRVELDLSGADGYAFKAVVPTVSIREFNAISADANQDAKNLPLYRRNADRKYWSYLIEEHKTLYFNYNSCREMDDLTLTDFTEGVIGMVEGAEVECLIIDLRNNLGGNSTLLEPFIGWLEKCDKINKEGAIYVIIGRDTFSSALLNAYAIKNKTKAVLVGEPSGGKPNCYGEVEFFKLGNSKVEICYSSKYYKVIKNDRVLSLFPDVERLVTFRDYIEKRDPCLEYILQEAEKARNRG